MQSLMLFDDKVQAGRIGQRKKKEDNIIYKLPCTELIIAGRAS